MKQHYRKLVGLSIYSNFDDFTQWNRKVKTILSKFVESEILLLN